MCAKSAAVESRIIYFPDSIIEYPKTLASLCLFHDQVLLFSKDRLVVERDQLLEKVHCDPHAKLRHEVLSTFIAGPYRILSQAGALRAYSSEESLEAFPDAG